MRSDSKSVLPLKCVIVDDEAGAISVLASYIEKTPGLSLAKTFRSSVEALNYLLAEKTDVVFLDIDMPELSGLQLSDLIRELPAKIIFCTAHPQYAVESYEKEAADYLLKPVSFERFLSAVKKVRKDPGSKRTPVETKEIAGGVRAMFVKSGNTIHRVVLGDILFLEKQGHYLVFHTLRENILSRMTMKQIFDVLPADNFIQVHKSWVVAVDKIDRVIKQEVVVAGQEIPIGDHYRREFFRTIKYTGK